LKLDSKWIESGLIKLINLSFDYDIFKKIFRR